MITRDSACEPTLEALARLPEEIRDLPRHKTACKYCGISYLMFRELTMLRQKLEGACKALATYDPTLANELISGEPTSLCKTQEDMQDLRAGFFTLRRFVQQTFQDMLATARDFEQIVQLKSQSFFEKSAKRFASERAKLKNQLSYCQTQIREANQREIELEQARAKLDHAQGHLQSITRCRDDLEAANAEMERQIAVACTRESTLLRQVADFKQIKLVMTNQLNEEFCVMKRELKERSDRCQSLSVALQEEAEKVKTATDEARSAKRSESHMKTRTSLQEEELDRTRHLYVGTCDQARVILNNIRSLVFRVQDTLQAQLDRAATLARFLLAVAAAIQRLHKAVESCKTLLEHHDRKHPPAIPESHLECQMKLMSQTDQFAGELRKIHTKHEQDLGRHGKRLITLKTEYEALQTKAIKEKIFLEARMSDLQAGHQSELARQTLELHNAGETCAKLTELRLQETARADVAVTKLKENLANLDGLTGKISSLTKTISEQKSEIDHLLHVVRAQCEERLALLAKFGLQSKERSVNGE